MFAEKLDEIRRQLEDHERRIQKLEEQANFEAPKKEESGTDIEQGLKKLAERISVEEENLKDVICLDGGEPKLMVSPNEEKELDKQRDASLAILTIEKFVNGRGEMRSQDLRRRLQELGIGGLTNLNTNLKKCKGLIIPRGKPSSNKFAYQITVPGINEGLRVIRELISTERDA